MNFAKGYLAYYLSKTTFQRFQLAYRYYNRSISEQVLNLSHVQKQAIFHFLELNALPENRYYFYDYFYDNCSTRIRDAFEAVLGEKLAFSPDYVRSNLSFRELIDLYAADTQPWGDFGIDLCLGAAIDQTATPYQYMFLPDYLEMGFDSARVVNSSGKQPFVLKKQMVFSSTYKVEKSPFITPIKVFWVIFFIVLSITVLEARSRINMRWLDVVLFGVWGLLGVVLFLLWVATDHKSAQNYNLLWAFPLHFPIAVLMLFSSARKLVNYYMLFTILLIVCLFLGWYIFPQKLHPAVVPLALIPAIRAFYRRAPRVFTGKLPKLAA